MKRWKKAAVTGAAVFGVVVPAAAACEPAPVLPPTPPPVAVKPCVDAGPLTTNVLDQRWQYPQVPNFVPNPAGCALPRLGMQVNLWISLAEGQTIALLLCTSKGGIPRGPIPATAVWLICMDVQPSKVGIRT